MGKSFWVILGIILVASVGLIFFVSSDDSAGTPASTAEALELTDSDHTQGADNASVVVIEYSDFECPACGALYPLTKQVTSLFADQVTFAYRHFPLVSIHQNAMAASRAAESAGYQGMFWEMHDMLFERQQEWSGVTNATAIFESYASGLGLDIDEYRVGVASEEASKTINSSLSVGTSIGVNATPTYFVNGEQIPTPQSVEEFSTVIQAALDSAEAE